MRGILSRREGCGRWIPHSTSAPHAGVGPTLPMPSTTSAPIPTSAPRFFRSTVPARSAAMRTTAPAFLPQKHPFITDSRYVQITVLGNVRCKSLRVNNLQPDRERCPVLKKGVSEAGLIADRLSCAIPAIVSAPHRSSEVPSQIHDALFGDFTKADSKLSRPQFTHFAHVSGRSKNPLRSSRSIAPLRLDNPDEIEYNGLMNRVALTSLTNAETAPVVVNRDKMREVITETLFRP